MKIKRPYAAARKIAGRVIEILSPYCEPGMCLVAGSVRRRASECGDIEIVCIPKTEPGEALDLFGNPLEPFRIREWSQAVIEMCDGRIEVGDPCYGRYTKGQILITNPKYIKGDCQIDIFMPIPDDFWRQFAIRTGSREFSGQIARKWVAKGWRGTEDGLRLASQCEQKGERWQLRRDTTPTLPPPWNSELEFFQWLGMSWVEPENR